MNGASVTFEPASPRDVFRYVSNAHELLSHGSVGLRRDALDIMEHALDAARPYGLCLQCLDLRGSKLYVNGQLIWDLAADASVWFFGAGKASLDLARGAEEVFGERLRGGLVICKQGEEGSLRRILLRHASHPIPDESSLRATDELIALLSAPRPGDLVVFGITGGSSALMVKPCHGLTLADLQDLARVLLTCGADITQINAVRKHVSDVGGGKLLRHLDPEVFVLNLTISDVVGDAFDHITDPTVPDRSTIADARATLDRFDLWERVKPNVRSYLSEGGQVAETPKAIERPQRLDVLLAPSSIACDAACSRALALGYASIVLSTSFQGESTSLGSHLGAIADEIAKRSQPLKPPAALLSGGETVVVVGSCKGTGGPNQEFVLATILASSTKRPMVVLGIDTDGTDGPTDIAGALCDGETLRRAEALAVDIPKALRDHDVTPTLLKLGDAVITGSTGTNVNDLRLLLVG